MIAMRYSKKKAGSLGIALLLIPHGKKEGASWALTYVATRWSAIYRFRSIKKLVKEIAE